MTGRRYIDLFNRLNYFSVTSSLSLYSNVHLYPFQSVLRAHNRPRMNMNYRVACMSSNSGADGRMPVWLMHLQQVLAGGKPPAVKADEPTPKVALGILREHVRIHFSRSGGPGGQNVNKVNTKVDMRFNVMAAGWLPMGVRERIVQMERNRINNDGEIVVSSTKTRSQKGNIDDALGKLQAIIDAAADVPPSQVDQKIKKIEKLEYHYRENICPIRENICHISSERLLFEVIGRSRPILCVHLFEFRDISEVTTKQLVEFAYHTATQGFRTHQEKLEGSKVVCQSKEETTTNMQIVV